MINDNSNAIQKLPALVQILNQITHRGAQFVMYASALGAVALISKSNTPSEFIAAGIGVNLMSHLIGRVAHPEDNVSAQEIEKIVAEAIHESDFKELLTKDDFMRAIAKLMRQQEKIFFTTQRNEFELQRMFSLLDLSTQEANTSILQSTPSITSFYVVSETSEFVEDVTSEVRSLWKQAKLAENYASQTSIGIYQDALSLIRSALNTTQVLSDKDLTQLQICLEKAEYLHDDIRHRHEIPTTKLEGQVIDLILYFSKLVDKDKKLAEDAKMTTVTYFSGANIDSIPTSMPVNEALEIARDRLMDFWGRKTQEYLLLARKYLQNYQPKEALIMARRCDELPGIHNEQRLGVRFSPNLRGDITNLKQIIEKELGLLMEAARKVQLARLATDHEKARILIEEAKEIYPFLPELQQLNQNLQR